MSPHPLTAARVRAEADRWGAIEDAGDGTRVWRCSTDALEWVVFVLGATGAAFEVRSPPELVDHLEAWRRRSAEAVSAASSASAAGLDR